MNERELNEKGSQFKCGLTCRENRKLEKEISDLLNRHSRENRSDTPDFILAKYLMGCLKNFEATFKRRDNWYKP